jgi:hypothetical protein
LCIGLVRIFAADLGQTFPQLPSRLSSRPQLSEYLLATWLCGQAVVDELDNLLWLEWQKICIFKKSLGTFENKSHKA